MHLVLGKVDLGGFLDFFLENWPRVHLHIWISHVDQLYALLGQDDEHEDVDAQGEHRPKPGAMGVSTLIVEGESVAEAILRQEELCETFHVSSLCC